MAAQTEHEVWWANYQREKEAQQKKATAEFFAKGESIPDLDMWPDCPICFRSLDMPDDYFYCPVCDVTWSIQGHNGSKGEG